MSLNLWNVVGVLVACGQLLGGREVRASWSACNLNTGDYFLNACIAPMLVLEAAQSMA